MAVRLLHNIKETTNNPSKAFDVGYRMGATPPWLYGAALGAGMGSFALPAIAESLGINPNIATIGSALIDTGAESFVNWLVGETPSRNLGYATGNLFGNLGGVYLGRQLTGTHDDPNGFIDSASMFTGEAIGDAVTNAIYGDIKWSEVPQEVIKTPFSIVEQAQDIGQTVKDVYNISNLTEDDVDSKLNDLFGIDKDDIDTASLRDLYSKLDANGFDNLVTKANTATALALGGKVGLEDRKAGNPLDPVKARQYTFSDKDSDFQEHLDRFRKLEESGIFDNKERSAETWFDILADLDFTPENRDLYHLHKSVNTPSIPQPDYVSVPHVPNLDTSLNYRNFASAFPTPKANTASALALGDKIILPESLPFTTDKSILSSLNGIADDFDVKRFIDSLI